MLVFRKTKHGEESFFLSTAITKSAPKMAKVELRMTAVNYFFRKSSATRSPRVLRR